MNGNDNDIMRAKNELLFNLFIKLIILTGWHIIIIRLGIISQNQNTEKKTPFSPVQNNKHIFVYLFIYEFETFFRWKFIFSKNVA